MDDENQHGYLVLADISAYTAYLAGVELARAREMIRAGLLPGTFVTPMLRHISGFTRSSATECID